jgi:hypothetical protein
VGLHQVLVEVLGSKSLIALPVEPLDFLDLSGRNPPRGRLAEPAVQQTSLTLLFIAPAPTAKCLLIDP